MADKVIRFKGDFDASQILASLKSIRSEMEKSGAAPSLFKGIDKDIDKAESLVKELTAAINNGFKDTKDVDNFRKKFETLNQVFSKVGIGLKDLNKVENFTKSTKSLQTLEKQLEKIQTAETKVAHEALEASKNLKGISTKAAREELEKAVNAGEDLEKVLKRISEQQFSKGQSSLNKILGKASTTDTTFKNAKADSLSANAGLASSFASKSEALNKYKQALLALATTSITAKEAFDQFGLELDEEGQKYIQSGEFAKAYMEDLKRLSLEAVSTSGMSKSAGAVGKAISTMGGAGVTDASGTLHMTAAESQAIQQYIDLLRQKGIITQEIAQEEATILAQAVASQQNFNNVLTQTNTQQKELANSTQASTNATRQQVESQTQLEASFNRMSMFVKQIFSLTTAWRTFNRVIRSTFNDIKALDKAFGSIAMVTSYSVSDMWEQYSTYAQMANKLGQTTQSVIEASGLYYQQGLETVEVMKLTEDTMKLATLAGLGFKDATSQMTGALRAFHMEMNQGAHVTDVYASLAASAAADVNGISEAMSATAAIAHSAGMSFENTSAMLTTMIEATQEAPKNLGTAMKSIIARFTELKNNVAGTAASEFEDLDYNKVDKALKSVGISIKDATGQFRNLDEVFIELSGKWNTLDRNTQRYIATIAAGSRQQSRFIALMENYDRTMELINVAQDSAGKADKQFAKYSDTVEFKLNRLKNAWEQTKTTIFTSEFYGGLLDTVTSLVEKLENLNWKKLLVAVPLAIAAGRMMGKNWITGFSQGINSAKGFLGGKLVGKTKMSAGEMQKSFYQNKEAYSEKYNINPGLKLGSYEKQQDKLIAKDNQIIQDIKKYTKLRDEALNQPISKANNRKIEGYQNQLDNLNQEKENHQKSMEAFVKDGKQAFDTLKAEKAELWKKQAWASAASGAAAAAGTALTMGLLGTFDPSTIAKTIMAQTATTAVSQLASGNYIGAGISALITGASFGLGQLFDYIEKNKEEQRRHNDAVYDLSKKIEEAEERQKKLNDAYDEANSKYEKQKEQFDNFNTAKNTYDELSKKVLLTAEEQEKLNEATKTLAEMHPELVDSYDAQGNAILSIGEAWDQAMKAEKEYYNSLKKDKIEAEADQLFGEYELAVDYQNLDAAEKAQKQALYQGKGEFYGDFGGIGWGNSNFFAVNRRRKQNVLTLDELFKLNTWDNFDIFSGKNDVESYVRELISGEHSNASFAEAFLKAYNEEMDTNIASAETAFDEMFSGSGAEEDARWAKIRERIQKEIESWENLDETKIDETKVKKAAANYSSVISDEIEFLLDDFKGTEEAKKQLIADLHKSEGSTEKIKQMLDEALKDNKKLSIEDVAQEILGKDNNQDLVKAYENATEYQMKLIQEYYSELYTRTTKENNEFREKLKNAGVADPILVQIDTSTQSMEQDSQKELDKLAEVYGNGFSGSKLETIFKELGFKAKQAFNSAIADSSTDPEMQTKIARQLNGLLQGSLKEIPTNVLQNLMGLDWSSFSATDLNKTKQQFIDFAEEQGTSIEEAEKYWNEYKNFMSKLGILDVIKGGLSVDSILDAIEEELDEKLKTAKISSAITSSLKNGFMTFSESNDFRKACEKIGIKATDYIKAGIGGMEVIDSSSLEQLRQDIIDKVASSADIIEIIEQGYNDQIILLTEAIEKAIKAGDEALQKSLEQQKQKLVEEREKNIKDPNSELVQQVTSRYSSYQYDLLYQTIKAQKEAEESLDDLTQAKLDAEAADRALERATEDLTEKLYQQNKAWEALQKSKFGDPNRISKLDGLNNYSAILDDISRKASKAKEKLDDLQEGDNVDKLLSTYTTEIHNEVVVRGAENEVIKQAIANTEAQLSKYSEYWSKFGDTYVINYAKLNATLSKASDMDRSKIQDKIEEDIEKLRTWTKNLQDNEDAIEKLRKQFEEDEKKALQSYVNLEKEVINTLKEQYEKQVNDLKEKNEAMKDADDDYLNALEKAINKERDLRNRQNQWDDLAKKEKKLSLISRDTSGTQQLEAQKLQQEVEKDRTQLLDDTIDDVVDSLKEMYELQQESREVEIEYMESMLDNAELIKQANEVLQNIDSNEDLVNWFMANKDLSQMTAAELELEKKNWNDLYDAKILYEKQSKMDFDKYLEATQAEINDKVKTISEDVTSWSEKTWNTVREQATSALHDAEETYKSAKRSYEDQELAMDQLKRTAAAAENFYNRLSEAINKGIGIDLNNNDNDQPHFLSNADANINGGRKAELQGSQNMLLRGLSQSDASTSNTTNTTEMSNYTTGSALKGNSYLPTSAQEAIRDNAAGQISEAFNKNQDLVRQFKNMAKKIKDNDIENGFYPIIGLTAFLKEHNVDLVKEYIEEFYGIKDFKSKIDSDKAIWLAKQNSTSGILIGYKGSVPFLKNQGYDMDNAKKFASGGIVDYTGPAWVDGSPSNPEAFLSVDDTRLIGNLVNLLTNIPSLNPNTNPTQFSTSNIGDTTVNLTVNFDSVSEDYDAERVIDLMKEKIVEAANYTGANVILNKR